MSKFNKTHHFFADPKDGPGRILVAVEMEIKDRRAQVLRGLREIMKAKVRVPFAYLPREEVVESPAAALSQELARSMKRIEELNQELRKESAILDSLQQKTDNTKAGLPIVDLVIGEAR